VLGVDLVYLATRYVATHESAADDDYRRALIDSSLDDVRLSTRVGGIPASLLACWLDRADAVPDAPDGFAQDRLMANRTAWSAGHSVSGVHGISSVCELIETLADEYRQSRRVVMGD
jgi:nitronate monooxygenase